MPKSEGRLLILHSAGYLGIARGAVRKAGEHFSSSAEVSLPDAKVAIIMAAVAVEAFANELAVLAERDANRLADTHGEVEIIAKLRNLATILDEIESYRGPTPLKYQAAAEVLAGQTFPKGEAPFQPFANLIRLRDLLIHPKPVDRRTSDGEIIPASRLMRDFAQRGLTRSPLRGDRYQLDWDYEVQSVPLARWAYESALNIIDSIVMMLPENVPSLSLLELNGLPSCKVPGLQVERRPNRAHR